MLNYDDLLQQKITDIENGLPIEKVVAELPAEAKELEPLIRLAAAVRGMPHPEPMPETAKTQQRQVMAAAQTHSRPTTSTPLAGIGWKWLSGAALAGAATTTIIMFIILAAGLGFWLNKRNQDTIRVESILGQVQVANNKEGTTWKNLTVGDRLSRGQRIRTLGASAATFVFFEGTHTFVSANSDLTFAQLNGSGGKSLQVEIHQNSGETWNIVTPLQGAQSFFKVSTPYGIASVHGTSFKVRVNPNGQAQFAVNTGEVRVNNDSKQVTLLSGQVASANVNGDISEATYQFNIKGSLLGIDESMGVWTVSGVTFQVTHETVISGDPQLGSLVAVSGRIHEDGNWIADTIEPEGSSEQTATFTGILNRMQGTNWSIGGSDVIVNDQTDRDANLATGKPVKVTFNSLEDGSWLALKIESLVDVPNEPDPKPTPTGDLNARPSYKFVPEELETSSCEDGTSYNLSAGLKNDAKEIKDYASNVQLGYLIDRGGEYVSTVVLEPTGWGRIEAGQTVPFAIQVTMNDTWTSAPEDSQVKLRIYISSATNRPDHLNGRLTVTIKAGCKPEGTPTVTETTQITPTVSGTPELTVTPSVTPEITPTGESTQEGSQCTGANPHPTGMKLAQRYGVSYDEIMKWFCDYHYGFGEIDLAYSLSRQYGKPVEEIFAMRASGMGWGNIKKALANTDDSNNKKEKEKGNDKKDKKNP
ncbi:MAG: FecR domain-containing protein [Anaerolineaceae bacterium]|nr:FecR domain-containing protein [Anaerolineaceae bacterium]